MTSAHSDSIDLLIDLIQRESITPHDGACQSLIAKRLECLGFSIEHIDCAEVNNLWARHGSASPLLVFAGHTDVVPVGDALDWTYPPFSAQIADGHLYGRGAADMKSGVAAMVTAIERYVRQSQTHQGSVALLLTSDEEGPAINGTAKVVETLCQRNETIDYCVLGEPTSSTVLGDVIRNGRRGSLGARMYVNGKQGHVAYPTLAKNPVHHALPALAELCAIEWDQGDDYFPPTTLQISNVHAGTGAVNVIPGKLIIDFNLRYSPALSVEQIKTRVYELCNQHSLDTHIEWTDSAQPFLTKAGYLTDTVQKAIKTHTGQSAVLDTGGGTSDGRFIAPTGAQLVEFGPINASIHQVDEHVRLQDVDTLSQIYETIINQLL